MVNGLSALLDDLLALEGSPLDHRNHLIQRRRAGPGATR